MNSSTDMIGVWQPWTTGTSTLLHHCTRNPVRQLTVAYRRGMVVDTWNDRDLPVLRAVVELDEREGRPVTPEDVRFVTGFDPHTVESALRALAGETNPKYFDRTHGGLRDPTLWVTNVTGHARRTVGAWPTAETLADQILAALNDAADAAGDEETRDRLRQFAAWLGGAGRGVLMQAAGSAVVVGETGPQY
jgi:hypothetical protein